MDKNKLEVLREIDYQIHPVCGNCIFGSFKTNKNFGFCEIHTYDHQKHSDSWRPLSIHIHGSCNTWVGLGPSGGWEEFMQSPRREKDE